MMHVNVNVYRSPPIANDATRIHDPDDRVFIRSSPLASGDS